jgi:hypothetical protein
MAVNAKEEGLKPEKIAGINKQQWQAIEAALAFDRDHRIQHAQAFLDKFTAKSKLPLYLTATVTLMAFIALGSLYIFKEAEMTPDIDFADLPIATQQTITGNIEEAKTALSFDDVNGALIYLNKGFLLHPYNPAIEEQLDIVINKILNSPEFNQQPATEQKQYIDELMKYESLSTNKTLQDYKDKL